MPCGALAAQSTAQVVAALAIVAPGDAGGARAVRARIERTAGVAPLALALRIARHAAAGSALAHLRVGASSALAAATVRSAASAFALRHALAQTALAAARAFRALPAAAAAVV